MIFPYRKLGGFLRPAAKTAAGVLIAAAVLSVPARAEYMTQAMREASEAMAQSEIQAVQAEDRAKANAAPESAVPVIAEARMAIALSGPPGTSISVYRIAAPGEGGGLALEPGFDGARIDASTLGNAAAYGNLAVTLEPMVLKSAPEPVASIGIGKDGAASLAEGLDEGLYLFMGAEPIVCYVPAVDPEDPNAVLSIGLPLPPEAPVSGANLETGVPDSVPAVSQGSGAAGTAEDDSFIESAAKDETTAPAKAVTRRVLVKWSDKGAQDARPSSVNVDLLKDGVLDRTIQVSAADGWVRSIDDLDASAKWTVAQRPEDGYVLEISRVGNAFVLSNSLASEPKDPGTGDLTPVSPIKAVNPLTPMSPLTPDADGGDILSDLPGLSWSSPEPAGPSLPDLSPSMAAPMAFLAISFGLGTAAIVCAKLGKPGGKARKGMAAAAAVSLIPLAISVTARLRADAMAGERSARALSALSENIELSPAPASVSDNIGPDAEVPCFLLDPERAMPVGTVDNIPFAGILEIPRLGLDLPVASRANESHISSAPARWAGSAYLDDLVIAGYEYESMFANIGRLERGDEIRFADLDGSLFEYAVARIEYLTENQVREMAESDYALTLFTSGGPNDTWIAIRCSRVDPNAQVEDLVAKNANHAMAAATPDIPRRLDGTETDAT